MPLSGTDLKVMVLAPVGRDARLLRDALVSAGLNAHAVKSLPDAIHALNEEGMGIFLITEEVLNRTNIAILSSALQDQPTWSDLPMLILTVGGAVTKSSLRREQDRLPLGSVTLLERPIRRTTLLSSVRSALRSRRRQYQVRDTLLERDRADESKRESESRLATAIETARLGTWELDVDSGDLIVSSIFRSTFDLENDEPITYELFLSRVHPDDRTQRQDQFKNAVAMQSAYSSEYRILWRDGSVRWISVSGRPLAQVRRTQSTKAADAESGLRFIGVTLDITERVLSEMALRKADKLALVGRLSSSIAHEINNPLESVTNLLYLISGGELGPEEKAYVLTAQQELARVSEIAAQTLTFNRQQNAHEEAVPADILESVLALYQGRLLTSSIHVARRYTYKRAVLCYPGELRQVFTNLIGNAFDATRQGGRILVRERLATHPKSGQKGVRITIADTGSGMTPEVKRHLFEAFHSTKGNNGTGLGLWISQGIAKKHGGSLRFRSSTDSRHRGTVFSLFLPS